MLFVNGDPIQINKLTPAIGKEYEIAYNFDPRGGICKLFVNGFEIIPNEPRWEFFVRKFKFIKNPLIGQIFMTNSILLRGKI